MTTPNHVGCAQFLKERAAALGVDANVSDARPGMAMPTGFVEFNMRCPHGVVMWMEPTAEQRLAWIRDGVA